MSTEPLVTIGTLNYNNGKYVIETLESIKAQTYQNIELVIVDDCSTDNSATLIANWLTGYHKPYKFIQHPKNLGICATCNDILKNASGQYISIIATDDIMMAEKVEIQVNILKNTTEDTGAVYSDAYLIKGDSTPKYGWFIQSHGDFMELPSGYLYERLLKSNFLPAMSLLIKKSCYDEVGLFDESLVYEDYDMWLRLSKKYKIVYSDYISVKYRVHDNSLSRTIKNWNRSYLKIYLKHLPNPIAIKKLEQITLDAYSYKDREYMENIKCYLNISKQIKKTYFLSKFRIPAFIGKKVIDSIS